MYTVGFIDEDYTEIKKIDRKLRDYFKIVSYEIPEGLDLNQLIKKVYESKIDILLIDYTMEHYLSYNGDKIAREFEKIKPNFPIIIFTNNENDAFPQVDNPTIIFDKSLLNTPTQKEKFIQTLKKLADNYYRKIEEKRALINQLIEKRETEGLNSKEKNDLFNLQLNLSNLDKWNKESPEYLLEDNKLDFLSNVSNDADETLKRLMNKYKK
jgi:DNA-binding NtrC family response regulator